MLQVNIRNFMLTTDKHTLLAPSSIAAECNVLGVT